LIEVVVVDVVTPPKNLALHVDAQMALYVRACIANGDATTLSSTLIFRFHWQLSYSEVQVHRKFTA